MKEQTFCVHQKQKTYNLAVRTQVPPCSISDTRKHLEPLQILHPYISVPIFGVSVFHRVILFCIILSKTAIKFEDNSKTCQI